MLQPDSADATVRKMAHPAMFPKRGSITTPVTSAAGTVVSSILAEDYAPPLIIQPPPVATSSPGILHPPPPQSLNIQSLQQSGAQKKKSGFQITSVIPAQISASMSSNNSIAEDTESYDDLDESHTEDLSSSEILDVSLSRTTDLGEPERSSSEETLNNFQEAETPGAISPNQPQHHLPPQNVMINGSAQHHHHHHPHHHLHHHHPALQHPIHSGVIVGPPKLVGSVAGGLFHIPTESGDSTDVSLPNMVSSIAPASVTSNFATIGVAGTNAGGNAVSGDSVNMGNIATSDSNITGVSGVGGNLRSSSLACISTTVSIPATVNVNTVCGTISGPSNIVTNASAAADSRAPTVQQPTAVGSRFRVVKLDSLSEPYKKGRWTCSEFYDKESTTTASEGLSVTRVADSIRPIPVDATSERESTSGSSVSSTVSTLSHYTESVGSGEMGAHSVLQQQIQVMGTQQQDFSGCSGMQVPSITQSVSQSQLAQMQLHSQEMASAQQKPTTLPSGQQAAMNTANVALPSSLIPQQPILPTAIPAAQQLSYSQQTQPVQAMPSVSQQQLPYTSQQLQGSVPHMAPGHGAPLSQSVVPNSMQDYVHQQVMQVSGPSGRTVVSSAAQHLSVQGQIQPLGAQTVLATPQPSMHTQGSAPLATPQPSVHTQGVAPLATSQPVMHAQGAAQLATPQPALHAQGSVAGSGGSQIRTVSQTGSLPAVVPQPSVNQPTSTVLQPNVSLTSVAPPIMQPSQPGIIQQGIPHGTSVLTPASVLPPQTSTLPPQTQMVDSAVLFQGMNQQKPLSPVPPGASVVHLTSSVPPSLSAATSSVVPSQSTVPVSVVQDSSLMQSVGQPSMIPTTNISLPQQMASQSSPYPTSVSAQPVLSQGGDARHSVSSQIIGAAQIPFVEGLPSGVGQEASSSTQEVSSTLLPVKTLPPSGNVDGEEDSASGASVVAIDNKIEQAMDLVKSHLMYAVREEVEVLKEQIKELLEKNSQLEHENNLLKTLASPEQLAQFQAQIQNVSPPASTQTVGATQPTSQSSGPSV
ncbi:TSC22 domain family protein 1 [Protopterus annectens]|uniref:TSC22 domain family protein 1 n=1 Tax=Protopterus annectens TaxID=7888 RepID=UPI001CF9825F|nr:TSC22 domain family protein 1 [Protopterus annectens]